MLIDHDLSTPPDSDALDLAGGVRNSRPRAPRRSNIDTRREALISRLWKATEAQIAEIEQRGRELPGSAAPERDARVLSILCRVVRDLSEQDEAVLSAGRNKCGEEPDEDGASRDLDKFREDLGRRLSRLRRDRASAEPAGDPEQG